MYDPGQAAQVAREFWIVRKKKKKARSGQKASKRKLNSAVHMPYISKNAPKSEEWINAPERGTGSTFRVENRRVIYQQQQHFRGTKNAYR